jgi:hypothetical protein
MELIMLPKYSLNLGSNKTTPAAVFIFKLLSLLLSTGFVTTPLSQYTVLFKTNSPLKLFFRLIRISGRILRKLVVYMAPAEEDQGEGDEGRREAYVFTVHLFVSF